MKLLTVLCVASLLATASFGQVDSAEKKMVPPDYDQQNKSDQDKPSVQPQDSRNLKNPVPASASKDGIVMKGGIITLTRNGIPSTVTETVLLDNGAQLQKDGTVLQLDGSSFKIKEGMTYDLAGNLKQENKSNEIQRTAPAPEKNRSTDVKTQPAKAQPAPEPAKVKTQPSAPESEKVKTQPAPQPVKTQPAPEPAKVKTQPVAPEPAKTPVPEGKKSEPQKQAGDKNMYLVPDSSVKDYKKDANPE
jgi:hypothetical protein